MTTTEKTCWVVGDLREGETARIQNKTFPLVGARLRLLRDHYPNASLTTEIVSAYTDHDTVTIRAVVQDGARVATGLGTSNAVGDKALADSLFELAETRAIGRALRFFGLGVDATGAEEVQGRRPLREREEDAHPEDKPTVAQLAQLRQLRTRLKEAGASVDDIEPPTTSAEAAHLLEQLKTRLPGGA